MHKIGKYPFRAEQFMCNFRKQLFTSFLINQMLCAADLHSTERDFGTEQLAKINKTWVLSRFAIEIKDLPLRHSNYNIETWVENAVRFFTNRNFRATDSEGDVFAISKSIWAMLDITTRQAQNLFDIKDGAIKNFILQGDEKIELPMNKTDRVTFEEPMPLLRTIDTYYNDVDFNGHINSCRYIEHVLDLFSMDWHKNHIVKRLDIVFASEAHCPDQLNFYCSPPKYADTQSHIEDASSLETIDSEGDVEYKIKITKKSPHSNKEIECCRVKLLWRKITL